MFKNRSLTSSRVVIGSPIVSILCSEEKNPFYVHKNLLTLHSQHLDNRMKETEADGEAKVCLPLVDPSQFVTYVGWMYTGKTSVDFEEDDGMAEKYCALGETLDDARIQNYRMDQLRRVAKRWSFSEKDWDASWPSDDEAKFAYRNSSEGSALRKFVADTIAWNNPFHFGDDYVWEGQQEDLTDLLREVFELSIDMNKASVKDWNGTEP
jgi:hypothetical protein